MLSAGCFYSAVTIAPAKPGAGVGGGEAGRWEPGHGARLRWGKAQTIFFGLFGTPQGCWVRLVRSQRMQALLHIWECPLPTAASVAWGVLLSHPFRSKAPHLAWISRVCPSKWWPLCKEAALGKEVRRASSYSSTEVAAWVLAGCGVRRKGQFSWARHPSQGDVSPAPSWAGVVLERHCMTPGAPGSLPET